jgi:hypothetical protein
MERERDAIDPDGSTEVLQQAAAAADYADGNPALH